MVLYAASILEAAVPVKGKGKKKVDLEAPIDIGTGGEKPKKEKRPLTDKQKAHLEKMAEARKAKKAALETPVPEPVAEPAPEPVVKKTTKRKKVDPVEKQLDEAVAEVTAVEEPPVKKVRTRKPKAAVDP